MKNLASRIREGFSFDLLRGRLISALQTNWAIERDRTKGSEQVQVIPPHANSPSPAHD